MVINVKSAGDVFETVADLPAYCGELAIDKVSVAAGIGAEDCQGGAVGPEVDCQNVGGICETVDEGEEGRSSIIGESANGVEGYETDSEVVA